MSLLEVEGHLPFLPYQENQVSLKVNLAKGSLNSQCLLSLHNHFLSCALWSPSHPIMHATHTKVAVILPIHGENVNSNSAADRRGCSHWPPLQAQVLYFWESYTKRDLQRDNCFQQLIKHPPLTHNSSVLEELTNCKTCRQQVDLNIGISHPPSATQKSHLS